MISQRNQSTLDDDDGRCAGKSAFRWKVGPFLLQSRPTCAGKSALESRPFLAISTFFFLTDLKSVPRRLEPENESVPMVDPSLRICTHPLTERAACTAVIGRLKIPVPRLRAGDRSPLHRPETPCLLSRSPDGARLCWKRPTRWRRRRRPPAQRLLRMRRRRRRP